MQKAQPDYRPDDQLMTLANCGLEHRRRSCAGYGVHYVVAGVGEPVLFIHGLNLGWGQWYQNLADLATDHQVIAVDLPGCGASSGPRYRGIGVKSGYVAAITALIEQEGLKDVTVVAHSFGAVVAMSLALALPKRIKRVILQGPLGFTRHLSAQQRPATLYPLTALLAHTVFRPTRANLRRFMRTSVYRPGDLPEPLVDYFASWIAGRPDRHPFLFMNSLTRPGRYAPEVVLTHELSRLAAPTLVLLGRHDPLVPLRHVASAIAQLPRGQLKIIEDAGHVPNLEVVADFNRLVRSFITVGAV